MVSPVSSEVLKILRKPRLWRKIKNTSSSSYYIGRNNSSNSSSSANTNVNIQSNDSQPKESASSHSQLPIDIVDTPNRPTVDPKNTSIILFPGQGAQYVGMTHQLLRFPAARSIFKLANEVLQFDLLKICLEGPIEKLNRTEYAQPAVLVSSLAALEQLREERPRAIENCVATAGFSLGEFTALVFAGALPFDKALRLVQIRATAMQMACDKAVGSMAMVLYGPDTQLKEACAKAKQWCLDRGIEDPYCGVANYLYPHCKVVAGHDEALKFLESNTKALKIRRIKRLSVNGAFHTPLMESAVEPFSKALKKVHISDPFIRVYSNVDGKPYRNASHILRQLPKQIVRPVKWEQTLHEMYARKDGVNFPRTFECGPGKGLVQVLQKVNAKAANTAYNVEA